ncbi:LamG-like jellyroll fold domain-containing protein [Desulfonema magnum]|uniref:Copper-binding domain-containing protein, DUF1565 n=1 Tax=Desulfonema magnum TaxID=45655 RepID=A0A975BHD8_9BACT|nr:LamG-like jellyroll fold domain-containing protein [Desulfonema magnum]QTA85552.1 Copper-binding domain-containing protein, DUF1565 [Desulfonema magnum]
MMIKNQITGKQIFIVFLGMMMAVFSVGTSGLADDDLSVPELQVAKNGSDTSGDGSLIRPFASIRAGIDACKEGGIVLVHPGTYSESIDFKGKNITVQSVEGAEKTIIDGSKSSVAAAQKNTGTVSFQNGENSNAVLSGFTITNGSGSGIYCYESGPTLEYLKITNNSATSGAGIFCDAYAYPVIKSTVISNNSVINRGGGVYCKAFSAPVLKNVEITRNSALNGGGIYCEASGLVLIYATLSDNSAEDGSGIFAEGGCNVLLKNSIIRDNKILFENESDTQSIFTVSYSNIQGGHKGIVNSGNVYTQWLTGNLDTDPMFADQKNGDYHLTHCSPCIGAGKADNEFYTDDAADTDIEENVSDIYAVSDRDIEGNPRPDPAGSDPDMGAYEHSRSTPISCLPQDIYVDTSFTGTETGKYHAPYNTITEAIYEASSGSTVHVAEGIYKEALTINNIDDLKIKGGWNPDTLNHNDPPDPTSTVIMAFASSAGIYINNAANTLIEGFTIMGDDIGVYVQNSSGAEIRSNVIRIDCNAESQGIHYENSSEGHIARNRLHLVKGKTDNNSAYAITLENLSDSIRLENNIIYLEGNVMTGIRELGVNATPATLLNNEFYGDESSVLYNDGNKRGTVRDCVHLNDATLDDISERGGNFCTLLPPYSPCIPPECVDVVVIPTPEDTDEDGMPDNFEIYYFDDISQDETGDADDDGLTNSEEYDHKTNPKLWDTDGDGMNDGWEVSNGTLAFIYDAKEDPDKDGYNNLQEYEGNTGPNDSQALPLARADVITTDENTPVNISVLDNDAEERLTIISAEKPDKGQVVVEDTAVTYIPAANFEGTDQFRYTVKNNNGNNATTTVTVYVRPVSVQEKSLRFDGADDYVIYYPIDNFPSTEMTLEFWMKFSGKGMVMSYAVPRVFTEEAFFITIDEKSYLTLDRGNEKVTGPLAVDDDEWHHIALTWQSETGNIKVFKDGTAAFSESFAKGRSIMNGGSLMLGGKTPSPADYRDMDEAFEGEIDDFRLWNYVRTQEEIQANMNKHLLSPDSGLALHWRFDEGSGQLVFDYSNNGNHGQLGSSADADENDPQYIRTSPLAPRDIYVNAMPGDTTGYNTITQALSIAPPGSVIRVAKGMYSEPLTIRNTDGLRLEGGWNRDTDTGEWYRDDPPDPNFTAIMATESPAAIQLAYAPNTIINGITVMGAETGMTIRDSENVEISNTIIHIPDQHPSSKARRSLKSGTRDQTLSSEGISYVGTSSGRIAYNRFHLVNTGGSACAITLDTADSDVIIENNIIYLQGKDLVGILETGADAAPSALLNNEFYGDETAVLYRSGNRGENITDCLHLNDGTLSNISEQGGNFCNLTPPYSPCRPPCGDVVIIPSPEDMDEDGMPDNWEGYYFNDLSKDGTGDQDDDGRTDLDEYNRRSNPVGWDVKVIILPQGATDEGARWSADGGEVWHESGETYNVSQTSEVSIQFNTISGWDTPPTQVVTPDEGQPVSVVATYAMSNYTLSLSRVVNDECKGKVKVNEDIRSLPWNGQFVSDETVTLEAIPDTGCKLTQWWSSGIISTTNPLDVVMNADMSIKVEFEEIVPHFSPPKTTATYMDITGNIYDSSDHIIADGDEVAAYVEDGNSGLLIVGYDSAYSAGYSMRVYGDDAATPEKDGAVPGDTIILKTYSASEEREHALILLSGENIWEEGVSKKWDWKYRVSQRIPLHVGWNLFSFSVNKCYYVGTKPECDMIGGIEYEQVNSIGNVLASIDGQYSYVRGFDCTGVTAYHLSEWSDMTYMAAGYGYEIKINEDADVDENGLIWLAFDGELLDGDKAIPLQPGWNLVGYLGNKVLHTGNAPAAAFPENRVMYHIISDNIGEAFCSINDQYTYIRGFDKTGVRSYNLTPWSDLTYVGPGYAYWIKVNDGEKPNLIWDSPCIDN